MGEIKSTLDIIMEKTRHLVLSPEERRQFERDEELRKVPGYVQKLLDDVCNDIFKLDTLKSLVRILSRINKLSHLLSIFVQGVDRNG